MTVPPPGLHGGDGPAVAEALHLDPASVLDLSVSLNPFAPDVRALARRHVDALVRYPDPHRATRALADAMRVDVDRELGPGWVEEPDFAMYRRHLPAVRRGAPRWRSNPHNPTGRLASPDETAAVWDEAFYALATGEWTRGDAGAVVVGSLTKLFACPGLRLGYVLAPDAPFADRIRDRQPRWAVNGLAVALVPELLERTDLPAPLGIVVRDCASFGLPECARIAVPGPADLERLEHALRAVEIQEVPA